MTQPVSRFLVLWMVLSALWLSALLIIEAAIRPAPSFAVMGSLLVGVPGIVLVAGLLWLRRKR
jgi:hypothetical protein